MDDISREPLPERPIAGQGEDDERGSGGAGSFGLKGPAEVLELADGTRDEQATTDGTWPAAARVTPTERLGPLAAGARAGVTFERVVPATRGDEPADGEAAESGLDAPESAESAPELAASDRWDAEMVPEDDAIGEDATGADELEPRDELEPEDGSEPDETVEAAAGDETPGDAELDQAAAAELDEGAPEGDVADPEDADPEEADDAPQPAPRPDPALDLGSDDDDVPELTDPGELSRVLFAVLLSSREALSPVRLAEVCNSSQKAVKAALERLEQDLTANGFPVELARTGASVKLMSSPAVFGYVKRLKAVKKADKLSPAALETLAVIAYRQPVIRAEVEAIRGVKVGPMLRMLLEHKLVKIVGRADVPGRPLQYGTTDTFLDRFGLASLDDLPSVQEFKTLG